MEEGEERGNGGREVGGREGGRCREEEKQHRKGVKTNHLYMYM